MIALVLRRLGLLLLALIMALAGLSAWVGLQRTSSVTPLSAFDTAIRWQPWGGPAWVLAARQVLASQPDPEQRGRILDRLARQYPLTASLWLENAQVALNLEQSLDTVRQLLSVAVAVEPGNPDILWRASMIALQGNDLDVAWQYLRDFITVRPREVDRSILVARRWLTDPQLLLYELVPDNVEALGYLLIHAAGWGDWELAEHTWQRLSATDAADTEIINAYIARLLNAGLGRQAVQVWRYVDPAYTAGRITNGGFGAPLLQQSPFAWQIQDQDGVAIARDETEFVSEPASLRVHFDGSRNLRLARPMQYLMLEPGRTYRLRGFWRAQALTTRALPYWVIIGHSNPLRSDSGSPAVVTLARINPAGRGDWPWQEFTVLFDVPDNVELVRLQLQRDPATTFDNLIAGELWIDTMAIEEVLITDDEG